VVFGVRLVKAEVKEPVPVPSVVLVIRAMDGFVLVDQTTPLAVMVAPPSAVIFPPEVAEVVAIAVKQGVQETGQLETYLSLQKEKNEYLNCLSIAAKDALTKAQRLARELGRTVGEAQTIQEGRAEASPPVFKMMEAHNMMSAKTASSAPTVDAGTQSFTASIQVSFKLK
jgi:hypothetical protein